jgi:hypothetical protein
MAILEQARAALAAINPALPAVALVLVLWAPQAAIRRWLPALWAIPASWGPKAQELRRVWQALPSLAGGALLGVLSAGGDPWAAAWGAVVAAGTPFLHHALKASPLPYQGDLGGKRDDDKTPPTGTKPVGLMAIALALTGCGLFNSEPLTPDETLALSQSACRVYMALPAEYHNDRDDKACQVIMRVCLVPAEPPAELHAPAPSYGNELGGSP